MKMIFRRIRWWFIRKKTKIAFAIWPLTPQADALMQQIGDGEVRDLRQIKPRDVAALVELVDRGLITVGGKIKNRPI